MAYNNISTGTDTFTITSANDIWSLGALSSLTTSGDGIDLSTFSGNTLIISGTINATADAIRATSSVTDITIIVEAGAVVSGASDGIEGWSGQANDDWRIINKGTISASGDAIVQIFGARAFVYNEGAMVGTGGRGVLFEGDNGTFINTGTVDSSDEGVILDGTNLEISNSGTITAATHGVFANGSVSLVNSGTITGGTQSIRGSSRSDSVINTGTLNGDVTLGDRADIFISDQGLVNGQIQAGAGADFVLTGAGAQDIFGDAGNDVIRSGANNDTVDGGNGEDLIDGGAGADELFGGKKNDVLLGGSGRDTLRGGNGDDVVNGEKGDDKLFGQGGADTFVFGLSTGNDVIRDWQDGSDLIDLSAYGIVGFAALSAEITHNFVNGDAVIDLTALGGSGSVTIKNGAGLMSADDFVL